MPTIVCANQVAEGISKAVKGTVSFVHQHGCAQIGADYDQTMRTFVGLGSHPNVSGVVVVGLGCEAHGAKKVAEKIAATGKPVEVVVIQEAGGTLNAIAQGARHAMAMVQAASMETRVECDLNELILATECGGSDACSGISANPALGAASDRVVDVGGTVILAETTELIGAEHLLARRAVNEQVACRCYEVIERMEKGAMALG
ncbi:MAG: UxaA family hydrolase, partial [Actinobacteria bacterium]|nr:UxaA family hydrolase [Actinomycetota bacterium]